MRRYGSLKNRFNVDFDGSELILYNHIFTFLLYSQLSLSRITAYLEEKMWSLFYHKNLKSGYKILWKRGEIAPGEQSPPFPQYFQYIYLIKGVKLLSHL